MLARTAALLLLILSLVLPLGIAEHVSAQPATRPAAGLVAAGQTAPAQMAAIGPASVRPPVRGLGAEAFWEESLSREARGDYLGAARAGEHVAEILPENVHVHWRVARDYMLAVEILPEDDREGRLQLVERSRAWAKRGRQLDPGCGECCLYDFASTARLAALAGPMRSMRLVREAGRTLEQCLESPPTWSDGPWSHERANLYHGGAVFLRLVPESRWLALFAGVHGDKQRAVALERQAVSIAPERVDYAVGLGAALICHGLQREEADDVAEGLRVLEGVTTLPDRLPSDGLDRRRAAALRADPSLACSDTREGQVRFE